MPNIESGRRRSTINANKQASDEVNEDDFERVGLKWEEVGSEAPVTGTEFVNMRLAAALLSKIEYSSEELDEFPGSRLLTFESYVKVGMKYFRPVRAEKSHHTTCDWSIESAGATRTSRTSRQPNLRKRLSEVDEARIQANFDLSVSPQKRAELDAQYREISSELAKEQAGLVAITEEGESGSWNSVVPSQGSLTYHRSHVPARALVCIRAEATHAYEYTNTTKTFDWHQKNPSTGHNRAKPVNTRVPTLPVPPDCREDLPGCVPANQAGNGSSRRSSDNLEKYGFSISGFRVLEFSVSYIPQCSIQRPLQDIPEGGGRGIKNQ